MLRKKNINKGASKGAGNGDFGNETGAPARDRGSVLGGILPGIGSALDIGGGILGSILQNRFQQGAERRQETRSHVSDLNEFLGRVAEARAFAPQDPLMQMIQGRMRANLLENPAYEFTGDPSNPLGAQARGPDEQEQRIINSLRNTGQYSLYENAQGGYDWQPGTPQFASTVKPGGKDSAYYAPGMAGPQYFGQNTPPPPAPPAPAPRRPEDEPFGGFGG